MGTVYCSCDQKDPACPAIVNPGQCFVHHGCPCDKSRYHSDHNICMCIHRIHPDNRQTPILSKPVSFKGKGHKPTYPMSPEVMKPYPWTLTSFAEKRANLDRLLGKKQEAA